MRQPIDLSGQKFGDLLVIKFIGRKNKKSYHLCKCLLCGKEFETTLDGLKGKTKCNECGIESRKLNLIGEKYGRLLVLSFHHDSKYGAYWECQCDCGKKSIVLGNALRRGSSKSCGCFGDERRIETKTTHGMAYSDEYRAWIRMIERTTSNSYQGTARYKGRGITVCDEWKHSFEQFYKDMGDKPSKIYSLDRINNNGNYEPSNCRWATPSEQQNNKSNNAPITVCGETKTAKQWADITGLNRDLIRGRVRLGWSPERAISEPVRKYV